MANSEEIIPIEFDSVMEGQSVPMASPSMNESNSHAASGDQESPATRERIKLSANECLFFVQAMLKNYS
jgi:hypothetical protein